MNFDSLCFGIFNNKPTPSETKNYKEMSNINCVLSYGSFSIQYLKIIFFVVF